MAEDVEPVIIFKNPRARWASGGVGNGLDILDLVQVGVAAQDALAWYQQNWHSVEDNVVNIIYMAHRWQGAWTT
jgi:hypothetical protein